MSTLYFLVTRALRLWQVQFAVQVLRSLRDAVISLESASKMAVRPPQPLDPGTSGAANKAEASASLMKQLEGHYEDTYGCEVIRESLPSQATILALYDQVKVRRYPLETRLHHWTGMGEGYYENQRSEKPLSMALALDEKMGVPQMTEVLGALEKDDPALSSGALLERFRRKLLGISFCSASVHVLEAPSVPWCSENDVQRFLICIQPFILKADTVSVRMAIKRVETGLAEALNTRNPEPKLGIPLKRCLEVAITFLENAANASRLSKPAAVPKEKEKAAIPNAEAAAEKAKRKFEALKAENESLRNKMKAAPPPPRARPRDAVGPGVPARLVGGNPASTRLCQSENCGPGRACNQSHGPGSRWFA
jgi:hypothetical protein